MLKNQNSNDKVLISIISIISFLKFAVYRSLNKKIDFKKRIDNRVLLIRLFKNTDSVSLKFKNSDQDWPSVDLLIYEQIWLYYG